MHLTLLALGSRGDVQPLVALGVGLRSAGHRVRLVSSVDFATLANEHDLDFHPIRFNAQTLLSGEAGQALFASGQNIIKNLRAIQQNFGQLADHFVTDISDPALWQTDVIVNQLPGGLFGYDAAQHLGIPYVAAAVMPLARTRAFPLLFFPTAPARLPGYSRLSYLFAEQAVWHLYRRAVNRWRRAAFALTPAPFWGHHTALQRVLTLYGFSSHVVPRPPDWPHTIHQTGYWFLDDPAWQPPTALLHFLDTGPPPIFVGFGSMTLRDSEATTQIVLDALRQSGQRGVLLRGWAGLGKAALPDTIFLLDYAPFSWLFPRMAAVVHHGGSGTTGAGVRSGVPSLVVPFVADQFFWGARLAALGVGPPPQPHRTLAAAPLAHAITRMVHDGAMRAMAQALGTRVQAEEGVSAVVALLESVNRSRTATADSNLPIPDTHR